MSEKIVPVGVAEMKISRQADERLVTHSLGSCLAVAVYDAERSVAGLIHFVFPMRNRDDVTLPDQPSLYAASGLPRLIKAMQTLDARREAWTAGIAGGGGPLTPHPLFVVGEHNVRVATAILEHLGIPIRGADVGGCETRSLSVEVGTGRMIVLRPGPKESEL